MFLLDEPASALDAHSERIIREAVFRLAENRTILVVAHRLSTIRNADHIIVLDNGTIAEQGRHEDLIGRDTLYRKLFISQADENIYQASGYVTQADGYACQTNGYGCQADEYNCRTSGSDCRTDEHVCQDDGRFCRTDEYAGQIGENDCRTDKYTSRADGYPGNTGADPAKEV